MEALELWVAGGGGRDGTGAAMERKGVLSAGALLRDSARFECYVLDLDGAGERGQWCIYMVHSV